LSFRSHHSLSVTDGRPLHSEVQDIIYNLFDCRRAERLLSDEYFINNDTETPPINGFVVCGDSLNDLWRDIVGRADEIDFLLGVLE
jgi:hypothetical protein